MSYSIFTFLASSLPPSFHKADGWYFSVNMEWLNTRNQKWVTNTILFEVAEHKDEIFVCFCRHCIGKWEMILAMI